MLRLNNFTGRIAAATRRGEHGRVADLCGAVLVASLVWALGVGGLWLVNIEGKAIYAVWHVNHTYLLIAAPLFLGLMSFLLIKWSKGYKGPGELELLLRKKAVHFPGWFQAMACWVIACIELGTGLSPKGFEGPFLAAAGGLSGQFIEKLRLPPEVRHRMARCGLGVAFGVLFRSPLAGLMCTFEFGGGLGREEFEKELIMPALVAHTVGWCLTSYTGLPAPFVTFSAPSTVTLPELVTLVLVGLCSGVAAISYVYAIRWSKKLFGKLSTRVSLVYIPVIGASIAVLLGFFFPIILGDNFLARAISDAPALPQVVLLGAIIAKIIATAAADGSYCAGGTVGPGILEGGMIGILLGGVQNPIFAVAGAACFIGPVTGLSLTLLLLAATRLHFAPIAVIVAVPLACSYMVCRKVRLYPPVKPQVVAGV